MAAQVWKIKCELLSGVFSGEVVFQVKTTEGQLYQGISPKHYADPGELSPAARPVPGTIRVRLLRNGGDAAVVRTPDGEAITVPASMMVA